MPRLSKKRFFKWARAHGREWAFLPTEQHALATQCCPIARYARAEGFRSVSVGRGDFGHRGQRNVDLPDWARHVVWIADYYCKRSTIRTLLRELRKQGVRP